MAPTSTGSDQGRSRLCDTRNPDLWQRLPLAHTSAAAVGLPMRDPAAILVITPGPDWHKLPSVRGPGGPSATEAGFAQVGDPFDAAWAEESVMLKPPFSSRRCRSLTSVHPGCHPPWHIQIFSRRHVYSASRGLKRSAKPIMEEGMRKGKRE